MSKPTQPPEPEPARELASGARIRVRNYTPHRTLRLLGAAGGVDLPQEGLARCDESVTADGHWDDAHTLPRLLVGYRQVTGLPEPEPRTVLLVSQLVVRALPDRTDLAFPYDLVRDTDGTVTGFRTLARLEEGS